MWNAQIKFFIIFFINIKIWLYFCMWKPIRLQLQASITSNLELEKIIITGFSSKSSARFNFTIKSKNKGFSKYSYHSSFRPSLETTVWLHFSFHRKKHFFFSKERFYKYSPKKCCKHCGCLWHFFSLRVDFSQTFWTRKNNWAKVRSKCTLRKGGSF